jgi:hypothetical protein
MIEPASAGFLLLWRLEVWLEMRFFVKKKGLTISRKPLILFGSPARTPFGFAQGKLTREPDYLS